MNDDEDFSDDSSYQWCWCAQLCFSVCRLFVLQYYISTNGTYLHVYTVYICSQLQPTGSRAPPPSAFKDVAYDVATQHIQQRPIRPLHCDAMSRYGGESRHREQDRGVPWYRAALADVQPLTNRRTKFVVLTFEPSGWTDPTVQKLVNVWEQQASRDVWAPTGVGRRRGPAPDTS